MDIAVLSGISRSAGGLFYAVSSLCRALSQSGGLNLTVYGADSPTRAEDLPAWGDIPVHPYRAIGPLQYASGLRSRLAESSPELVHRHGIWTDPQWAALQWQKRSGRPVILSPHGMLDPWALDHSAWKKRIVRRLFAEESLQRATCLHALCRSEWESIRHFGLNNPVALIPNGVNLPDLSDIQPPEPVKTLLYLGRIHPKKGVGMLLEAWTQAQARLQGDWRLVIAGWDDGGYEHALREQAAEAGGDIEFVGPMFGAEKDQLLRRSDAFILPSLSEGLPMSILEAWSYGLPVMMTEACNIPEGFEAHAALRIEPDVESIADGIGRLDQMSKEALRGMGQKGRALVEEKFSWPKIASDMKAVYEWCLGGGDAPACVMES